jgi:hypothetical protein
MNEKVYKFFNLKPNVSKNSYRASFQNICHFIRTHYYEHQSRSLFSIFNVVYLQEKQKVQILLCLNILTFTPWMRL